MLRKYHSSAVLLLSASLLSASSLGHEAVGDEKTSALEIDLVLSVFALKHMRSNVSTIGNYALSWPIIYSQVHLDQLVQRKIEYRPKIEWIFELASLDISQTNCTGRHKTVEFHRSYRILHGFLDPARKK